MGSRTLTAVALLAAALFAAGCAGSPPVSPMRGAAPSGAGQGPECPATVEVSAPPTRVVTMDAASAAFLIRLGVGDRIVGTGSFDFAKDFSGDLRSTLDALPRLGDDKPDRESVLAAEPDFVTAVSAMQLGGFDGTPTIEQLRDNGAAVMVACGLSDTAQQTSLDPTYVYVTNLAAVFGVPERGAELVAEMKAEVAAAAPATSRHVPVLLLTSVPAGGAGINTRGGGSYANAITALAGGRNLAGEIPGNFVTLSAEQIAASDPAVIVILTGFSTLPENRLVASITSSPLLTATTAVRKGNVVLVPQTYTLSPSLLNAQAVRTIAAAVAAA